MDFGFCQTYGCPSLLAWKTVHSALLPGAGFDFDSHNKGTFHSRLSGTIAQDFIWPQIPNSVTFREMGILKISSMSLIWPHCTKMEFTSFYKFPIIICELLCSYWTNYSATTILEKCRKVFLQTWIFFLVNHFSRTRKYVH